MGRAEMLTVDEVLEERRKAASRKAVVVEDPDAAAYMREVVEEGVEVLHLGQMIGGRRFDLILVMARPRGEQQLKWFDECLLTAGTPGGRILIVAPRLSFA